MSVPTLLVPGQLKCGGVLFDGRPVDFITKWVGSRLSSHGNKKTGIKNRILIINASTGSGKSTVMPVAVVRVLRGNKAMSEYIGPGVICIQPRVLTAISLANDVAIVNSPWNSDMILGETVGYTTGPRSLGANANLLFATIGVLIAQFNNSTDEEIMAKYKIIIIDEAHERSTNLDLIMIMLKNFYTRNKDNENLPFLFFASATMDTELYRKYFDLPEDNVVAIEGRTYPIIEHWPDIIEDNYMEWAAKIVKEILISDKIESANPKNDILIFIPGSQENKFLVDEINKINNPSYNAVVLSINSEVVNAQLADYIMLFSPYDDLTKHYKRPINRRIVVSTIVAETGLTINTLKHIIDCGWVRSQETYFPWNVTGLLTRPAPKSRIKQRKGRVGRLFPGHFYPMYSKEVYEYLDKEQMPEIVINGMSDIFLSVIRLNQENKLYLGGDSEETVAEYDATDSGMLTPPNLSMFLTTQLNAVSCGFISPNAKLPTGSTLTTDKYYFGYGLTNLGNVASKIDKVPFELIRMIFAGHIYEASLPDLILLAALCDEHGASTDLLYKRGRVKKGEPPIKMSILINSVPQWMIKLSGETEDIKIYNFITKYISDDFIEDLLICEHIAEKAAESSDITGLTKYCESMRLNFGGIIDKLKKRDEIMDTFIAAGFNPFAYYKNSLTSKSQETFMVALINLKKCIYDSLRTNMLELSTYNEDEAEYRSMWGLKLQIPMSRFINYSEPPKCVIYNHIGFISSSSKDAIAPLLYKYDIPRISIIDGYFNPDINILGPNV